MEKRFWIGIALLVFLLAIGFLTAWGMERLHTSGETMLEQAQALALEGDMAQAVQLSRQAEKVWQDSWHITASTADHEPMDDVDRLFSELQVYAHEEDVTHFAATCAQLSVLVRAMYSAHSLTIWNLM